MEFRDKEGNLSFACRFNLLSQMVVFVVLDWIFTFECNLNRKWKFGYKFYGKVFFPMHSFALGPLYFSVMKNVPIFLADEGYEEIKKNKLPPYLSVIK